MQEAQLIEIFSSFQGEGPYIGQAMSFVRFQHCAFSCQYCDTPDSFKKLKDYRVEFPQGSLKFLSYPNPVSPESIEEWLKKFANSIVSLTGGEPLHHSQFLAHWLPRLDKKYQILLETSGILFKDLKKIIDQIDTISMDIKLPTATGMRPYWEEHRQFIQIAKSKELYIKVVLSANTPTKEWQQALDLVYQEAPNVPFILQPITPRSPQDQALSAQEIKNYFDFAKTCLNDVRVIPQLHVQANWL